MPDSIVLAKLEENLAFFNKMYDVVRLVDPVNKIVIEYRGCERRETDNICYDYWKNGKICDNCISVRAHLSNKCILKLEQSADEIMMVTALPIENVDKPTILELLKIVTDTMTVGSGIYSEVSLMRNFIAETNELAIKDKLTGLYNRRYVDERLPADIVRATMEKLPLSLVFLDLDNLKKINDIYGHSFGDKILTEITNALVKCIRSDIDWAARYGGDEFIICLYNTAKDEAYRITERIRCKISELVISTKEEITTTASLGIYTMEDTPLTAQELISLADKRMYEAKQLGRNRTVGV